MNNQELSPQQIEQLFSAIAPTDIPPQHLQKDYQPGWNHLRAEEQRQQIKTIRPWAYRKCNLKKLAEKMDFSLNRNGLYSSVLDNADLKNLSFSVTSAEVEHLREIEYTEFYEH